MLIGQCGMNDDAEIAVGNLHLIEDRNHVHTRTTGQGSQHQAFWTGAAVVAAVIGRGVHYNFMAADIRRKGHAFVERGAYKMCSHKCNCGLTVPV